MLVQPSGGLRRMKLPVAGTAYDGASRAIRFAPRHQLIVADTGPGHRRAVCRTTANIFIRISSSHCAMNSNPFALEPSATLIRSGGASGVTVDDDFLDMKGPVCTVWQRATASELTAARINE